MTATTPITAAVQSLTPGTLVDLFRLDARPLGGGLYHFTPSAAHPLRFGGTEYAPVGIEAEGFELTGTGSLPTPKLRITNVTRVLAALVATAGDLLGADVVRLRTLADYLDDGPDPDPGMHFPADVYRVERLATFSPALIEWELSAALDQEGRKLPGRQVLRDACTHRYRRFDPDTGAFDYTAATCPWTGTPYRDAAGAVVGDAVRDACGKRLSDCRARFGQGVALPTRAFPAVGRTRL